MHVRETVVAHCSVMVQTDGTCGVLLPGERDVIHLDTQESTEELHTLWIGLRRRLELLFNIFLYKHVGLLILTDRHFLRGILFIF